jgi:hypothetical protein
MNMSSDTAVGFIRYSGLDNEGGVIDAASAGAAPIGLDQVIRHFNEHQTKELVKETLNKPLDLRYRADC